MTSPQRAHASVKSESKSPDAPDHSPKDKVQFVAVPQASLPSQQFKWQSFAGGRKSGRVFPYGEKRMGDGDFGPASLVEQDGSLLLVYESKRHEGRTFRFELTQKTITHKYFRCKDCVEYARLHSSQVDKAVKPVGVRNGRLLTDPDKPKGRAHICMKQKQIPQPKQELAVAMSAPSAKCTSSLKPESFGRAEYADDAKYNLMYKSRRYLGTTFHFVRANRYLNRAYYDCHQCRAVKDAKKLNMRLGTVIVCDDEIVGRDPDLPHGKIGHICVKAPPPAGASAELSCKAAVAMVAETGDGQADGDDGAGKELVGSGSHDAGASAKNLPACSKRSLQPAPKRFGRVIFDDNAKEKIVYYNNGSHGFKFDLLLQNVTATGIRRKYRCSACFEASGRTGIGCAVAIALNKYFVDVDPTAPNGVAHLCRRRRQVA